MNKTLSPTPRHRARLSHLPSALAALLSAAALAAPAAICHAQDGLRPAAFRAAEARERDAETLRALTDEGQVLYQRERVKLDGYEYCSQAVALAERGEFRESIRAASKALVVAQQGQNENLEALAKRDLAIAYSYAGNLDRADEYARAALALPYSNPAAVAAPAQKVIADVLVRRGKQDQALVVYQRALASASPKFKPLVQISIVNTLLALGRGDEADRLLQTLPEADTPNVRAMVLRTRGNLKLAQNKHREALDLFTSALRETSGTDSVYQQLWLTEGIARTQAKLNNRAAALAAYKSAIDLADNVRAKFRSDEFKTGLFGNVQYIFEDAIALAAQAGDFPEALRMSERSRARALLDTIRERTANAATGHGQAIPTAADLAALQKTLREDEAIVEFHTLQDRLVVWVVRRDGITGSVVQVSRADLTRAVEAFRGSIVAIQNNVRTRSRELYDVLIKPVAVNAGERLIIVPHGPLHYLPFQALHDGSGYLIERNPIAIAPSAGVVLQAATTKRSSGGNFVGFGNPDLLNADKDLPGAQREVELISGLFSKPDIYLKSHATKARFREKAAASGLLHVAAHAEVDNVDPLYSRVLLAPEGNDDGQLQAREIFDLDLRKVHMVTLSACESGLGKIAQGDEIVGFTRSFLSAGVSGLIVSLWPVSDESTELLMSTMYRQLKAGQPLQDAMRSGQVAVLRNPRFSHPFFWAPFNLIGNWRLTVTG